MTLAELGREYAAAADALRERVRALEVLRAGEKEDEARLLLEHRLRLLRSMHRDTRAVARYLEHYYEKGSGEHAKGIL